MDGNDSGFNSDDEINNEYFVTNKGRRDSFSDEDADPNRDREIGEIDDLFTDVGAL